MTNKDMIDLANSINCKKSYESFFEFASNFLMNQSINNDQKSILLFKAIKQLSNNPKCGTSALVLGKQGNHSSSDIKDWCRMMLNDRDLHNLSADELHYVMGYCARLSKIQSANI